MEMGFIGLGKMGGNMVKRLLADNHRVIATDLSVDAVRLIEKEGAVGAADIKSMIGQMQAPRFVWMMVPSGEPTEDTTELLMELLSEGDTIIDGGNSYYKDSVRRAKRAEKAGIHFIDAGTSGGVWGLKNGYCLMVGGVKENVDNLAPILKTLAPTDGYLHTGAAGSGHYVKMVHNGIEYGMLQAYAEGFELMEKSDFNVNLGAVASLWNKGSVVRSWILELAEDVFKQNPDLDGIKPFVEDSGEGRWTVIDSIEKSVPAPVITLSLLARFTSRHTDPFGAKVIAALRNSFGGHKITKS